MAQTLSIYNNPLSGNLGNQTYKNYGGKQVVTTRFRTTSAKGDGASRAQRDTRMLMPNLTLIGSQLREWLPALWENNKFYKRPYTHFISHNMSRALPVLPKDFINDKRCVWGQLQVSCGSLPTLKVLLDSNKDLLVGIKVNSSTSFDTMSIADFSSMVVSLNTNFNDGDYIVFIRAQYENVIFSAPQDPYVTTCVISALRLDKKGIGSVSANFKGSSVSLASGSSSVLGTSLLISGSSDDSWACVHVRKERGRYLASSQIMSWDFNGASYVDNMFRQDYIDYCAASWGYKDKIL